VSKKSSQIHSIKKIKPLGNTSPWGWLIEPAFGCNLKCGHCCAELIPEDKKGDATLAPKVSADLMDYDTWCSAYKIINKVSPTVRVDLCGFVGEPTLHPHLTDWLSVARELAPLVQIQITTNGTMLRNGKVNYKSLLDAGANIIYTDQYGPNSEFEKLAKESGYPYYQYYDKPEGAPTPWKYYGPHLKMIVLMDPPHKWPKSRFNANLLGNWYGNLNWKKGKSFGMKPLEEPLTRRCNQPFLYVSVAANGNYLLCCQDGMHTFDGMFENVSEGVGGFRNFWYGEKMQVIRRRLRNKDRAATPEACGKCNITFSRSDFKHWQKEQMDIWYQDGKWNQFDQAYIES